MLLHFHLGVQIRDQNTFSRFRLDAFFVTIRPFFVTEAVFDVIYMMQPDIAAPGIDILASYTLLKSLTGLDGDTQYSEFTLMSGTSMSCPHVAGVAAYVKSFHPNWSQAAIRSAIMTTGMN